MQCIQFKRFALVFIVFFTHNGTKQQQKICHASAQCATHCARLHQVGHQAQGLSASLSIGELQIGEIPQAISNPPVVYLQELNGKVSLNYRNERTLRELTKMLLLEYFELRVDFAPGSLVPTLALRLNYILWLEDLLEPVKLDSVRGIDIGK